MMELNINSVNLFGLENGIRITGWLIGLFIFWRIAKAEIPLYQLYRMVSIMFVGALTGQIIASILGLPATLMIVFLWSLITLWAVKKIQADYWTVLDGLVLPLLFINIVSQVVVMVNTLDPISISVFIALAIYLFVIMPWTKRSYRILTWYPSGKSGFIFLFFIGYLLIINLLIAFYNNSVLYWLGLITVAGLVITITLWYQRSARNWKSEFNIVLKSLRKD